MHKQSAVLSFALLAACSTDSPGVSMSANDLFVASGMIWPSPTIAVCWDGDYAAADEALVQNAVARWGTNSNVRFTGWQRCTSSSQGGIHITVADGTCANSAPACAGVGTSINGKQHGVTLNFTFSEAPITINGDPAFCMRSSANRQWCITTTAVHEFGHALGFLHEQNRPDSASGCDDSGSYGDVTIGPWDSASVMEYCNAVYNNSGQPSFWDTVGIQQFYGAPLASFSGSTQGTPAVGQNLDGRIEVFTLDSVRRLVHSWQGSVNGPFVPWSDFGFVAKFPPTVARNSDGRLAVFAVDNNGATWVSQQVAPNSYFGPMVSLGGVTLFQPTVGRNLDGRCCVARPEAVKQVARCTAVGRS